MTRLAEPIIIAQWWKNRGGESVRVTLSTYADRNLVDLRTWFTADGKLQPGKGFAADVRHLPRGGPRQGRSESDRAGSDPHRQRTNDQRSGTPPTAEPA